MTLSVNLYSQLDHGKCRVKQRPRMTPPGLPTSSFARATQKNVVNYPTDMPGSGNIRCGEVQSQNIPLPVFLLPPARADEGRSFPNRPAISQVGPTCRPGLGKASRAMPEMAARSSDRFGRTDRSRPDRDGNQAGSQTGRAETHIKAQDRTRRSSRHTCKRSLTFQVRRAIGLACLATRVLRWMVGTSASEVATLNANLCGSADQLAHIRSGGSGLMEHSELLVSVALALRRPGRPLLAAHSDHDLATKDAHSPKHAQRFS